VTAAAPGIEVRTITTGKYWTVYHGKDYLGAIAFADGGFRAVSKGQVAGEASCFEFAVELLKEAQ
jgi:hypothetical protein